MGPAAGSVQAWVAVPHLSLPPPCQEWPWWWLWDFCGDGQGHHALDNVPMGTPCVTWRGWQGVQSRRERGSCSCSSSDRDVAPVAHGFGHGSSMEVLLELLSLAGNHARDAGFGGE